jgi:hypothetical protein
VTNPRIRILCGRAYRFFAFFVRAALTLAAATTAAAAPATTPAATRARVAFFLRAVVGESFSAALVASFEALTRAVVTAFDVLALALPTAFDAVFTAAFTAFWPALARVVTDLVTSLSFAM